ncbi:hypothetical protein K0U00_11475 [Paenibacillus sepulcri]|uniref:Spore coat protein B n=1 Tax=Paenibacillus sepulcri TaxID=359917 RepID=A0ABS7C1P5_9BACL|nr:hypothetical protein [Paenibacillus sepulcri]
MEHIQKASHNKKTVSLSSNASPGSKGHKSYTSNASDASPSMGGGSHYDNYLNSLIGKQIKINRGGPESLVGRLVGVQSDYVALYAKEGTVYINSSHVKSITELEGSKSQGSWTPNYIVASDFVGVLHKMVKSFAQVNWGGPEKVEGFIAEVGNQSLLLVVNGQDLMRIPLYHIKTVKSSGKYASSGSKGNKSGSGSKSGGTQGSGSGGKSGGTQGSRTGGSQGNKSGSKRNSTGGSGKGKSRSNQGSRNSSSKKSGRKG